MSATTKYLMSWTPWKVVSAAAVKAGWDGKDGSVADYVDVEDYLVDEEFTTFAAAVRRARMVEIHDTWGCPQIRRYQLVNDYDDLGNDARTKSWETDAMWELVIDGPDPVEASPDVSEFGLAA